MIQALSFWIFPSDSDDLVMLNGSSPNSTPPSQPTPGPSSYYQNQNHYPYPQDPHLAHAQFTPYPNGHHPQPSQHHRPTRSKSRRGGSYNARSNNYQHQHYTNGYQPPHNFYPNAPAPGYNYHTYPHQWSPYYPIPSQALTPTSPGTPIHPYQELHHIHPMHVPEEHPQQFMQHSDQPFETLVEEPPAPEAELSAPVAQTLPPKANDIMELGSDPAAIMALQASLGGWAIWTRRPHDPANAPGIIISPRTKPPSHILEQALDIPTPPPTPPPPPRSVVQESEPVAKESAPAESLESPRAPQNVSVPSSSATDTTPTTTRPASPASSSTSASIGNTSSKPAASADGSHPPPVAPVSDTIQAPSPTARVAPPSPAVVQPAAAPEPSGAPPAKKSWASLLRPAPGSAQALSQLPVSSVVGFSIPADALPPSAERVLNDSKRVALLALLNGRHAGPSQPVSGYAGVAAAAPPKAVVPPAIDFQKIRSRGLVNSGNMCFANAVLQVLVYCQPFHSFFAEVGKLLPPHKATSTDEDDPAAAPLVRATVNFLQEFMVKTPSPSTKGKERARNGNEETFNDGPESDWDAFLPTNFYDAMKEKKRFDSMRVSIACCCRYFSVSDPSFNREASKKTPKSFSGSSSTLWRRSFCHYLILCHQHHLNLRLPSHPPPKK